MTVKGAETSGTRNPPHPANRRTGPLGPTWEVRWSRCVPASSTLQAVAVVCRSSLAATRQQVATAQVPRSGTGLCRSPAYSYV